MLCEVPELWVVRERGSSEEGFSRRCCIGQSQGDDVRSEIFKGGQPGLEPLTDPVARKEALASVQHERGSSYASVQVTIFMNGAHEIEEHTSELQSPA